MFLPADRPDIARWAVAALACGAIAVVAVNLSFFLPPHALNGLHAPHRQTGSFGQMRAQLSDLEQQHGRLLGEYRALLVRFNLLDDNGGEVVQRLAAVEKSLPLLIESLPLESDIDRSLLTAAIGEIAGEVFEVDGGTMIVRYSPLFGKAPGAVPFDQPMPPVLTGDGGGPLRDR